MYYDDYYEFEADFGHDEWEEDEADEFSCDNCGPWCPSWIGDGLCELAIEQQAKEHEEYFSRYVAENVPCPVCREKLTQYEIPTDELWVWPGGFYNPMIALEIFAVLGAPKGEIHRSDGVCHIWVGIDECRRESLVKLTGASRDEDLPF